MTYLFTLFIVATLVLEFRRNEDIILNIKKYYFDSWKNWIIASLMIGGLIIISGTTHDIVPSFLQWGWTDLFYSETTNIAMAPVTTIENIPSIGFDFRYIILIGFLIVFSMLLPGFALREEQMFRENVIDYKTMIINSLKFGFVHMIVGISIYVALILSVMGFIFALIYKYVHEKEGSEKALLKTTSIHAGYNFILMILIGIIMSAKFYYNL